MSTINFAALATGSLGFTMALAWNRAVSTNMERWLNPAHDPKAQASAAIVYAVVITLVVIVLVTIVNHTRKVVYQLKNGGNDPVPDENMRGSEVTPRPNCLDCEHCKTSVVNFWSPPACGEKSSRYVS